jgi:hypothetical protein
LVLAQAPLLQFFLLPHSLPPRWDGPESGGVIKETEKGKEVQSGNDVGDAPLSSSTAQTSSSAFAKGTEDGGEELQGGGDMGETGTLPPSLIHPPLLLLLLPFPLLSLPSLMLLCLLVVLVPLPWLVRLLFLLLLLPCLCARTLVTTVTCTVTTTLHTPPQKHRPLPLPPHAPPPHPLCCLV